MFFKLLMFGLIAGVGAYYYDLNSAEKKIQDAEYGNTETEFRCRQNHESMCKYYMTVKLPREQLEYKFQIPGSYYRSAETKNRRYPVVVKQAKIFPKTVLGLAPNLQTEVEKLIKDEK